MIRKLLYLFVICFAGFLSAQQIGSPQQILNGLNNNFFIKNNGQWNPEVKFLTRIGGMNAWITNSGVVYDYYKIKRDFNISQTLKLSTQKREEFEIKHTRIQGDVVSMQLENSRADAVSVGNNKEEGYYNYFIGNDKSKWASFVPLYKNIEIKGVYKNIDVKYYYDNGRLRYDYIAEPGADISQINFNIKGQEGISVNKNGELVIKTSIGEVTDGKIFAYQSEGEIRKQINCRFEKRSDGTIGLNVKGYDVNKKLIIDPLVYSTFLGKNNLGDNASSIKVDANGDAYITGFTETPTFPVTSGAYQNTNKASDVFITKLNSAGSALIYSTFLGGTNIDQGNSIALDSSDNVYVTGESSSTDFPVTSGAFEKVYKGNGFSDAFITKLNPAGSALLYSSFLGGSSIDEGYSIAVDQNGNAYVTGLTYSTDFPITNNAFQSTYIGYNNNAAFVTKINSTGSALVYSTFLEGDYEEVGYSIAVDSSGNAYITGNTNSGNFPVTPGAFQSKLKSIGGGGFTFITKLNPAGSGLVYSTFLGGSSSGVGNSIVIDKNGNAYITGITYSNDFPVTGSAFQTSFKGNVGVNSDAFVCELNSTGSGLVFSTFLGGSNNDQGNSIAINKNGDVYLTGNTSSSDFPVTSNAFQTSLKNTAGNSFVTELNPSGSALVYSTYLGGSNASSFSTGDIGNSITIDKSGNAFVTGQAISPDFPTTPGAYQTAWDSSGIFVTKLSFSGSAEGFADITSLTSGPVEKYYSVPVNGTGYVYFNMFNQSTPLSYSSDFNVTLIDSKNNQYQASGRFIQPGLLRIGIPGSELSQLGSGEQTMSIQDSVTIGDTVYHLNNTPPNFNIEMTPLNYSRSLDFFAEGSAGASAAIGVNEEVTADLAKLSVSGTGGLGFTINTGQNNNISLSRRFEFGLGTSLQVPDVNEEEVGKISAGIEVGVSDKSIISQTINTSVVPGITPDQAEMTQAGFILETLSLGFGNFSPTFGLFVNAVRQTLLNISGIGSILNDAVTKNSWGLGVEGTLNSGFEAEFDDVKLELGASSISGALMGYTNYYPHGLSGIGNATKSYGVTQAYNYDLSALKFSFANKDGVSLSTGNNGLFGVGTGMETGARAYYNSSNQLQQLNLWLENEANVSLQSGSLESFYKTVVAVPGTYLNVLYGSNFSVNGLLSPLNTVNLKTLGIELPIIMNTLSKNYKISPVQITTYENLGKGIDMPFDISIDKGLGVGLGFNIGMDLKYFDETSFPRKYSLVYGNNYNYLMYSTGYSNQMDNFDLRAYFTSLINGTVELVKTTFNNILSTTNKLINAGKSFVMNGINKTGKIIGSIQGSFSQNGQLYASSYSPNYPHLWSKRFNVPTVKNYYSSTKIFHRSIIKKKVILSSVKTMMIAVSDNMKISFIPIGQDSTIDSVNTPFTLKMTIDTAKLSANGFTLADTSRIKIYRYDHTNNSWISEGGKLKGDTIEASVSYMANYLLGIELTNTDDKTPPQIIDYGPKDGSTFTTFPEIYAKIQDNQYGVGVDWSRTYLIANGDTLSASFDPTNQMIFYNLSGKDSLTGTINVNIQTTDYNGNRDSLKYSFNLNVTDVKEEKIVNSFKLLQNYPNPFNPTTRIDYSIKKESDVKIIIYNSIGQYITTLVDKKQAAGNYSINFNGIKLASGVYFYSLSAKPDNGSAEYRETRKMILLK